MPTPVAGFVAVLVVCTVRVFEPLLISSPADILIVDAPAVPDDVFVY